MYVTSNYICTFALHKWRQVVMYHGMMRLHCLLLVMTRQTIAPFSLKATKLKYVADCVSFYFFFFLAQTSVYSNIIFCEVSWGEKQFGHPHCNSTHSPCWMQQTPHVTVLSILETQDRCLVSSPFCLQASLFTPFLSSSPPGSDGGHLASFPICSFCHCHSWLLLIQQNPLSLASSLPSNSLALHFHLPSETSLLCPSHKTKQTKDLD